MGIPRICPALMETFRLFHGDLHSTGVLIMHNGASSSISVPSDGPHNRRLSLQGLAKNRLCLFGGSGCPRWEFTYYIHAHSCRMSFTVVFQTAASIKAGHLTMATFFSCKKSFYLAVQKRLFAQLCTALRAKSKKRLSAPQPNSALRLSVLLHSGTAYPENLPKLFF